jgi:hypothetical protein
MTTVTNKQLNKVLKELIQVREFPCVTIILPTHRTHPENAKDPVLLKDLMKEAKVRLLQEADKKAAEEIYSKLETLAAQIDHQYNTEGLALFVSPSVSEYLRLPVSPKARTVVDASFEIRDILRALHKTDYYYAMVLSKSKVRLFAGIGKQIEEVSEGGFPLEPTFSEKKIIDNGNAHEVENKLKEFFNRADKLFWEIYKNNKSGHLILFGDTKNIGYYKEVADHPQLIIGSVEGSYDAAQAHELAEKAQATVEQFLAERRKEMLGELEKAFKGKLAASGINEVYRTAQEGRGRLLFVEEGYQQAAKIEDNRLFFDVDPKAPGVIDDLVDDIVETVLQFGGQVVFVPDGTLEKYDRIAMILRY